MSAIQVNSSVSLMHYPSHGESIDVYLCFIFMARTMSIAPSCLPHWRFAPGSPSSSWKQGADFSKYIFLLCFLIEKFGGLGKLHPAEGLVEIEF
mmetsp:Transcript_70004/g.142205  ORF Transcript_70004/g.142205 Transcript_70004/m.142205 type:complete len:94 (+) Transcript_70004:805-1086(+)